MTRADIEAKLIAQGRIPTDTPKCKPSHTPGRMNGLEAIYAQELELLKRAGWIHDYKFEAVKFRLADKTYYTPDFMIHPGSGMQIEFHEVKGGIWRDDARVKIKMAAELFPWFTFIGITFKGKERKEEFF